MHERKHIRSRVAAALAVVTAVLYAGSGDALAQCQYEVTAVIQHECDDVFDSPTFGQGMNDRGDVVGYYWPCVIGNERAFFWSEETGFVTLPTPPDVVFAWAYDINDDRIIVGQHSIVGEGRKGFVYDMNKNNGVYQYLEPLHDGVVATNVSSANAINNSGVVAGMRVIGKSGNTPHNAVIWRPFEKGSPVEDLGVMEGPNSWAAAINDAGHATGGVGLQFFNDADVWVFTDRELTFTGFFPGGTSIGSTGINSSGTISCGGRLQSDPKGPATQGALWDEGDWEMLPLPPTATGGGALAINDHRQTVGRVLLPGGAERGVLWQHGEGYMLIDLVAPGGGSPLLERGRAINNAGQILARAATRAVLLTPIDVPFTDLNFDCRTDAFDLLILLDAWGPLQNRVGTQKASNLPGPDFNSDGVVDGVDLLILLQHWDP